MVRMYDLRQKEIINIKDGGRFGFVTDIEFDEEKGKIKALIVPGPGRILGMFGRTQEYKVPWDGIKRIGEDIILIDCVTDEILVDCE